MTDTTASGRSLSSPWEWSYGVAAGVVYRCRFDPRGPWLIHVATIDLAGRRYALKGIRAGDRMFGRETVSSMAARRSDSGDAPVVVINGDFFDLGNGEVENNAVVDGDWAKGVLESSSPHDEFDNAHSHLTTDSEGRPMIGRFALDGSVRAGARTERLAGINFRPPKGTGLVLFTPAYGSGTLGDSTIPPGTAPLRDPGAAPPSTRPDSAAARARPTVLQLRADSALRASLAAARTAREVAMRHVGRHQDTTLYLVVARDSAGGSHAIPADGAVLSATGSRAQEFVREGAKIGDTIRVIAALTEADVPAAGAPATRVIPFTVVGGWPGLVRNGLNIGVKSDSVEGTFPRFSAQRHPRSGAGISRDGNTLFLVVVDGRRSWSAGMSLAEFADLLIGLGAAHAMNFDGGGSSTLWVGGSVMNYPSDPTGERAVGNALAVVRAGTR